MRWNRVLVWHLGIIGFVSSYLMLDDSGLDSQPLQAPSSSFCCKASLHCSENLRGPKPTPHLQVHSGYDLERIMMKWTQSSVLVESNLAKVSTSWASYLDYHPWLRGMGSKATGMRLAFLLPDPLICSPHQSFKAHKHVHFGVRQSSSVCTQT